MNKGMYGFKRNISFDLPQLPVDDSVNPFEAVTIQNSKYVPAFGLKPEDYTPLSSVFSIRDFFSVGNYLVVIHMVDNLYSLSFAIYRVLANKLSFSFSYSLASFEVIPSSTYLTFAAGRGIPGSNNQFLLFATTVSEKRILILQIDEINKAIRIVSSQVVSQTIESMNRGKIKFIDHSRFIIAGAQFRSSIITGSISGDTITIGNASFNTSESVSDLDFDVVDNNHVIISYGVSNIGYVKIVTLDGNIHTVSNAITIPSFYQNTVKVTGLGNGYFVVTDKGRAVIGQVTSNTTVSWGTNRTFSTISPDYSGLVTQIDGKIIIVYNSLSNNKYSYCVLFSYSGNVLTKIREDIPVGNYNTNVIYSAYANNFIVLNGKWIIYLSSPYSSAYNYFQSLIIEQTDIYSNALSYPTSLLGDLSSGFAAAGIDNNRIFFAYTLSNNNLYGVIVERHPIYRFAWKLGTQTQLATGGSASYSIRAVKISDTEIGILGYTSDKSFIYVTYNGSTITGSTMYSNLDSYVSELQFIDSKTLIAYYIPNSTVSYFRYIIINAGAVTIESLYTISLTKQISGYNWDRNLCYVIQGSNSIALHVIVVNRTQVYSSQLVTLSMNYSFSNFGGSRCSVFINDKKTQILMPPVAYTASTPARYFYAIIDIQNAMAQPLSFINVEQNIELSQYRIYQVLEKIENNKLAVILIDGNRQYYAEMVIDGMTYKFLNITPLYMTPTYTHVIGRNKYLTGSMIIEANKEVIGVCLPNKQVAREKEISHRLVNWLPDNTIIGFNRQGILSDTDISRKAGFSTKDKVYIKL